jgi:hypothetical protein
MDPAIAAMFAMMQQNQAAQLQIMKDDIDRRDRRAERDRKVDQEQQQTGMRLLIDQIANIANSKAEKPRAPTVRLPNFDIDKDAKSFPQWKSRWDTYIKANKLHTIEDLEERNERQMGDLKAALTDNTLRWLTYREMPDADRSNPEMVIKQMEDHIKESINPIVAVIELVTMKRYPNESADHLNARINEKLAQCDFTGVHDIRDYIGLIATIQACEVQLRKRMFYDKVNTHAKAAMAVKAEEQATSHSKMLSDDAAKVNAMSTYKKIKSMIANSLLKNNTNPKEEEANTEVKVMEAMAVTPASLETRVTTDKIRKEAGHNQDQELKTNQTHNHPSQKHATDVEKTIMINLIVGSKIKYVSTVTKWVT